MTVVVHKAASPVAKFLREVAENMKATGYFGIPGHDGGKVHAVVGGNPVCGRRDPRAEFQWCSNGHNRSMIECEMCRTILALDAPVPIFPPRSSRERELLKAALSELRGRHNELSHDTAKQEKKCPRCRLQRRIRKVLENP